MFYGITLVFTVNVRRYLRYLISSRITHGLKLASEGWSQFKTWPASPYQHGWNKHSWWMSCNNHFARYRSTALLRSSGFTRASRSSCRSQLHCRPTSGIGSLWTIFLLVCGAAPIASEHQVAADVRVALTTQWPVRYSNTSTFQSTSI